MVLQEHAIRLVWVSRDLVNALPVLRVGVGIVQGDDATVARRPALATICGLVDPSGGHRNGHPAPIAGMRQNGVETLPAASWLPCRPVRMFPEAANQLIGNPAVLRAEERGWFCARPHHFGLGRTARLQLPHPG